MDSKNFLNKIKSAESSISTVLGIVVVVLVGVLLLRYFRGTSLKEILPEVNLNPSEISEEAVTIESEKGTSLSLPAKYTVEKGDNLWNISVKFYNDGFQWVKISEANDLLNPGVITQGQELIIPKLETEKVEQVAKVTEPINQDQYTVVKGDNLWNICVRAYQDGFKWLEIAKVNNLANPNLIYPGNVLTLPR